MRRTRSRQVGNSVWIGATTPNRNGLVMPGLLSPVANPSDAAAARNSSMPGQLGRRAVQPGVSAPRAGALAGGAVDTGGAPMELVAEADPAREEIPERRGDLGTYRGTGDDHADHRHRRVRVPAGTDAA